MPYSICLDCHFIFQGRYVGDAFLKYYYRHSPMLRTKKETAFEKDQNRRQANFLNRYVSTQGKNILEIGAHAGSFLRHLHREFGSTVYYEELSEEARQLLSSFDELNDFRECTENVQMDVVVLRHVLEHIHDLSGFLNYLKSIVVDDGFIFIEVPDWSVFDENVDPFIFEHLSQFNTSCLVSLLRTCGWHLEALEKSIEPNDPATPNRVMRIIARKSKLPALCNSDIVKTFFDFSNHHHDGWKNRLNSLLKNNNYDSIALYPASHLTFTAITETKLLDHNVIGMFDIDDKKQGKKTLGLEVYSPKILATIQPALVLIFTMAFEPEIRESFKKMGLQGEIISISNLVKNSSSELGV